LEDADHRWSLQEDREEKNPRFREEDNSEDDDEEEREKERD
jgi:hypothetical protein